MNQGASCVLSLLGTGSIRMRPAAVWNTSTAVVGRDQDTTSHCVNAAAKERRHLGIPGCVGELGCDQHDAVRRG